MARWVRRRSLAGRVLAFPSQGPGILERYGVTPEAARRAAWTVESSGAQLGGAAAMNRVLSELGGMWRMVAIAYSLRPIAALEEVLYRRFARNRHRFARFGVTPECDEPDARCG